MKKSINSILFTTLIFSLAFTVDSSQAKALNTSASKSLDSLVPNFKVVDPCTLTSHDGSVKNIATLEIPGFPNTTGVDIYIEKSMSLNPPKNMPVVLIVNGNSYAKEEYDDIAEFLAKNGFLIAVARRENNGGASEDPLFILGTLDAVFDYAKLNQNSPVGLIGHSRAGLVVNNAAIENHNLQHGYKINAVINVAPNIAEQDQKLTGEHAEAFLSIWGSRDSDMKGESGTVSEGIAAYDMAGTESTTCDGNCILFTPKIDKTSVYVYGANHAEFLGTHTNAPWSAPNVDDTDIPKHPYLNTDDQFCIGKAYLNAFLRKHLNGDTRFNGFLRNRALPKSLAMIVSDTDDGLGQEAGSALRIKHQFSPRLKLQIENFEDEFYELTGKSAQVFDFPVYENNLETAPYNIRHKSKFLWVSWEDISYTQYIGFAVDGDKQDISEYTHLSLRAGLVNGVPWPMYSNESGNANIRIGLSSANGGSQYFYRELESTDKHTTMQTIVIPLEDFAGVDLEQVNEIFISFAPGTKGSIILDNLEFIRDYE